MPTRNYQFQLVKITLIAALGGLLFGFDTGVISGAQIFFTDFFNLTEWEKGWAVSSALVGALAGALMAGYLTTATGRKRTLLISAILFLVSAWGSGMANSLNELVIYRIIGGIGVGVASMTAPMYIAEISPADKRGKMVSLYQLSIVIGFFVVFVATWLIGRSSSTEAINDYNLNRGWRVMFWSEIIPAGLFFLLLFLVPRSPRWLVMNKKQDEARGTLEKLMTPETATTELEEIQTSLSATEKVSWKDVFGPKIRVVVIIGILLSVFQQITGINAILYYAGDIFSNALGYGKEDALQQQLWLAGVNLAFTVLAIYTVDRWGRKPLLIVGSIGMLLGLLGLGGMIYFQQLGVMALLSMLLFCGAFSMSMGPVVWVMLSEIFPNKYRSTALSIAVAAQWLFNGIVAFAFPVINESSLNDISFNGALPYFIFASMAVLSIIFTIKMVPETKNKSLEEIEKFWKK